MKGKAAADTTVAALRELYAGREDLRLVLLFGSGARGELRPDSDLDVAVDAGRPMEAAQRIELIEALAQLSGRAVDLVDLRRAGQPLLGEIMRGGLRVHGSVDAYVEWASRNLVEQEDFLPLLRRGWAEQQRAWLRT